MSTMLGNIGDILDTRPDLTEAATAECLLHFEINHDRLVAALEGFSPLAAYKAGMLVGIMTNMLADEQAPRPQHRPGAN